MRPMTLFINAINKCTNEANDTVYNENKCNVPIRLMLRFINAMYQLGQ